MTPAMTASSVRLSLAVVLGQSHCCPATTGPGNSVAHQTTGRGNSVAHRQQAGTIPILVMRSPLGRRRAGQTSRLELPSPLRASPASGTSPYSRGPLIKKNSAVTLLFPFIVRLHVRAVPVQSPNHPLKPDGGTGV